MASNSATDAELVLATRNGDKQAFGHLVLRHLATVRRLALRLINNQEIAQDLAQEAMLQAYLSLGNLREADKFQNWLYSIVRNVCHSYLRSQRADFFIGHFLLGLVREDQGMAITILRSLNVDPEQVCMRTLEVMFTG